MKLKDGLSQLLGKRICGAVVKEGDRLPRMQVFLIFDDDTYYEVYTDSMIYGTGGVVPRNRPNPRAPLLPVEIRYVLVDFLAAVMVKVQVDVGHLVPVFLQEPLEQQIQWNRVDACYPEAVKNE